MYCVINNENTCYLMKKIRNQKIKQFPFFRSDKRHLIDISINFFHPSTKSLQSSLILNELDLISLSFQITFLHKVLIQYLLFILNCWTYFLLIFLLEKVINLTYFRTINLISPVENFCLLIPIGSSSSQVQKKEIISEW